MHGHPAYNGAVCLSTANNGVRGSLRHIFDYNGRSQGRLKSENDKDPEVQLITNPQTFPVVQLHKGGWHHDATAILPRCMLDTRSAFACL